MTLTVRDRLRLEGVHPDLVRVIERTAEQGQISFIVTEGLRSPARQAELVKAGASKTMNSRHITGHAVDLAVMIGNEARWDWPLYAQLAKAVKSAAKLVGVPIEWGGDWFSFKDGPHFQLPRSKYP